MVKTKEVFKAEWNMTTSQASDYLGVHINTLRNWCNQRMVNYVTIGIGRHRRFRRKDLDLLLVPVNKKGGLTP